MPLASFTFLVAFLPVVAIVAHLLRDRFSPRTAQAWILLASLVFYSRSGWRYLLLLLASAAFNWAVARSFRSPRFGPAGRSRMLKLGLTVDVLVLCVVKYAKFLLGPVVHSIGRDLALPTWAFPLGVSFYTLTQVMYLVDCYENLVPPNSAFDHATFVSFFPNVSPDRWSAPKPSSGSWATWPRPTTATTGSPAPSPSWPSGFSRRS